MGGTQKVVHKLSNKFDRLFDHLSTLNKTGSLDLGTTEAEQALPDYVKHAMKTKTYKRSYIPDYNRRDAQTRQVLVGQAPIYPFL